MTPSEPIEASNGIEHRLEASRRAEKEQALVYRNLASLAEAAGDVELAQRFHDLHADEQHHLARLTARLLELGARPAELSGVRSEIRSLEGWQLLVQEREDTEIQRYQALLAEALDPATRALVEEILAVEARHSAELGGKWTMA